MDNTFFKRLPQNVIDIVNEIVMYSSKSIYLKWWFVYLLNKRHVCTVFEKKTYQQNGMYVLSLKKYIIKIKTLDIKYSLYLMVYKWNKLDSFSYYQQMDMIFYFLIFWFRYKSNVLYLKPAVKVHIHYTCISVIYRIKKNFKINIRSSINIWQSSIILCKGNRFLTRNLNLKKNARHDFRHLNLKLWRLDHRFMFYLRLHFFYHFIHTVRKSSLSTAIFKDNFLLCCSSLTTCFIFIEFSKTYRYLLTRHVHILFVFWIIHYHDSVELPVYFL